ALGQTDRSVAANQRQRPLRPPPTFIHIHTMQCNACLYDGGGNRSTRSKPTQARGEHANSTQNDQPGTTWNNQDSNPGSSCCEATVLTTEPPCCPVLLLFCWFNH